MYMFWGRSSMGFCSECGIFLNQMMFTCALLRATRSTYLTGLEILFTLFATNISNPSHRAA